MKVTLENWQINLNANQKYLTTIRVKRGILQGDSLSPLLFVLAIEPLSRILNEEQNKLTLKRSENTYNINHFIFIDDIKVLAENETDLHKLSKIVETTTKNMGFEINVNKSATNSKTYEGAIQLEENEGYKF